MKQCKCEHWQECPVCQPSRFDADGNRLPPEPTPLQAARAQIEKDTALLRQALEALESAIPWIVTDRNTFAEVVRARHFQREDTETDESILSGYDAVIDDAEKATTALRAALAEPDHIPDAGKMVAEPCEMGAICLNCQPRGPNGECPDAPQPRRRLTDEEIDNTTRKQVDYLLDHIYEYGTAAEGIIERVRAIARAIEAAVWGEKT